MDILQHRELKNEKTVALVRIVLALTGIIDILSYFDVMSLSDTKPTVISLLTSAYLLIYSTVILILLKDNRYRKKLKFFVICFDYSYVFLAFLYDPTITENSSTTVWFAFAGTLVFYLINLLRYSRSGTLVAMFFTAGTFVALSLLTQVDPTQIIQVGIALSLILFIGYSITSSNIRMMEEASTKQMMERYLPPQLVTELINGETEMDSRGKKQEVTILFSDIRSFTEISEKIPPEEVVALLNRYLSKMTDIIYEQEGTIDKFIGDAIMTIFGAPLQREDDILRCIITAIEMNRALKDFNFEYQNLPRNLEIGVGIHTGEAIAGNIGSDKRLDYTVIGDTVNLASRIESLTKFYGTPILITGSTRDKLQPGEDYPFLLREIDRVIVKGRSEAVEIFQVQDIAELENSSHLIQRNQTFSQALVKYRNRGFEEAKIIFNSLTEDRVAKIYSKRCDYCMKNPPEEKWMGTHRMVKK